jgi:hypothetical protein
MRSAETRARTSDLLQRLAESHGRQRVAIGDIASALGDRSFGVLILVLALPNALPGPSIPGFSALFALPLLLLTIQIVLRRKEPRLPEWLLRRSLSLDRFRQFLQRILPYLRRLEGLLRPRPNWLIGPAGHPVLGLVLLLLTLVLALPIPLANTPVAVSLVVIALALLERDGRALAVGLGIGGLACGWIVVLIVAGARLAEMVAAHF